MTETDARPAPSRAKHPNDYFYEAGMDIRPAPPGVLPSPMWLHLRKMQFAAWMDVPVCPNVTPFVALAGDHLWQGDKTMDALVKRWRAVGAVRGRADFEQALEHGIESLPEPLPELVALFAEVDTVPDWFDATLWERGRQVNGNTSLAGEFGWVLQDFLTTVVSHHVSTTTGQTRHFSGHLFRRSLETAAWFAQQTLPNGWQRNSEPFKDAVRLRLMHAQARTACDRVWDPKTYAHYGNPIPASTMMGAAISFGMTSVLIDHSHGRFATEDDLAAILMYWGYIAHLLGVPQELIPRTVAEALQLVDYIYATNGGPTWGTEITMGAIAPPVTGQGIAGVLKRHLARAVAAPAMALCHYYGGGELTQAAFDSTPYRNINYEPLIPAVKLIIRIAVDLRRIDDWLPSSHARMIRRTAAGNKRLLLVANCYRRAGNRKGMHVSYSAHDSLPERIQGCPVRHT